MPLPRGTCQAVAAVCLVCRGGRPGSPISAHCLLVGAADTWAASCRRALYLESTDTKTGGTCKPSRIGTGALSVLGPGICCQDAFDEARERLNNGAQ